MEFSGDFDVSVTALAGGILHLRYAARGARRRRSWAVLKPPPADPDARDFEVDIAADGRVRVCGPDGKVLVEDVVPFAVVDGEARLVRTAGRDRVYGLGERVGGLDRRGRAWTFWNTDAYDRDHGGWAPGGDPLYQSIPFELRFAAGVAHGIFTDEPRHMVFDYGTHDTIRVTGADAIEQYVIAGPRLPDVVARYVALTGRPAIPPRWAFGFHQCRWGYADAAELEAIAARFRAERLPCEALWLDIQHMRDFRCFTFGEAWAPAFIARLAAQGFRVVAIVDPGVKVDPGWDVYDEGVAGGHFLRRRDGELYVGSVWAGPSVFPDFSRPATRAWWGAQITRFVDHGLAGIWLDMNEPALLREAGDGITIPDDVPVDGGGDPTTMATLHNAYALLQARATYEALAVREPRPFVLTRAGSAGIGAFAAVWTGDTPSTWGGLAQTLPMLLGLGLSGVPIVGSDVGGFSGGATGELYARWLALGVVSPFCRAHVAKDVAPQEPWSFGDAITDAARTLLALREELRPYLEALAEEANRTGAPILRPLVWEFPDDPTTYDLADQAMLGPRYLVAPIVEQGATRRTVYLPAGRWTERTTGAVHEGPTTVECTAALDAVLLFTRS